MQISIIRDSHVKNTSLTKTCSQTFELPSLSTKKNYMKKTCQWYKCMYPYFSQGFRCVQTSTKYLTIWMPKYLKYEHSDKAIIKLRPTTYKPASFIYYATKNYPVQSPPTWHSKSLTVCQCNAPRSNDLPDPKDKKWV